MNAIFDELKIIFNNNSYRLYMIGGASRDYLLNREIGDYDFVTNAKPEEVKKFLDVDMTFANYGTVKYFLHDTKIDITTLRKEADYEDKRHPSKVEFVDDINIDYKRRDFTINAIYIDESYQIIDPSHQGVKDLKDGVLRFIGDPETRIKEDPLRILRGERFSIEYNLKVSDELKKLFASNKQLLEAINSNKISEEYKKLEKIYEVKKNARTKL